jgi:hypothetical protein
MKARYLFIVFVFLSATSYSQFLKNEKLIGGNLDFLRIKEVGTGTGGGPLGSTPSKETYISFRPEFIYIINKNTGVSIFGELLSSNASNASADVGYKTKGFAVGIGLSKYKFFTAGFGIFGRAQVSYSPSSGQYYDTTATFYPKNSYDLTNISLLPGVLYRFSKHFTLQATIGKISYDHLITKIESYSGSSKHDQFSASFSNLTFSAFYIFK